MKNHHPISSFPFPRACGALLLCLLVAVDLPARPPVSLASINLTGSMPRNYRADRILVKPLPGVDLGLLNLQLGATVLRTFPDLGNLQVLQVPAGSPILSLVSVYRQSGLVQYAEPDYLVRLLREPNDFRFWDGSLWALRNTGQLGGTSGADIEAPAGWDTRTTAENIVVAVVDTGVRLTHEDLAANLWTNPGESGVDAQGNDRRTNGLDDDGNGYVDDVRGINALTGSGNPADDFGHGTHINGIIGGVGDNSVGVVGVAWRVQLMNCKFIDAQGNGAISDAVACIDYARREGARLINASWGTVDFQSQALRDAITAARDTGLLFVAAAGNSAGNNDTTPLYPASYDLDNIVAVAATNRQDNLAFFSNYGATTVDLAAPGEDIFSAWSGSDSDYQYLSGSSMATGYVSGVAALLMAQAPNESFTTIRQRILAGTDPLPSLQGRTVSGGRLNLAGALGGGPPPTAPAAPSNLSATATSASTINLTWTDNADNEQGFRIERSLDNASFTEIATLGANVTSYASTGLNADTTYYYRVRAFNGAGNSGYSNTANARTQAPAPTVPAAPSNLTATATSASNINLTWTDNADNEQGFRIERSLDNASFTEIATVGANATSYASTGLAADTTYYYRVRAFNGAGNSGYSNTASARTQAPAPTVPAAPSNLTATATSASSINLTWTDNADNEQGFRIERSLDNASFAEIATVGANATSYSSAGLNADTIYYYRVRAFNGAGNSGYSNTASARTQAPAPTVPAAPSNLTATATSASNINLTWTDNADNEQGFRIERSLDNASFAEIATVGANATSYSSAGLNADTIYYYRVRAFNGAGNSGYSNTASARTQAPAPTAPAAPSNLSATATSASTINLTWTDNADNEQGFRIERSLDNASFAEIATVGAGATSYSSTGLNADTTYYYRVRAFNGAGNSGYSNTASARTQTAPPPPETATVTVFASDALANEAGPDAGALIISRSGDTGVALTVNYSVGGTATNGGDYQTLGGTVTIPAGASSVTVQVMPVDDRVIEPPELVTLTLTAGTGYRIGLPGSALVTIMDNDVLTLPLF